VEVSKLLFVSGIDLDLHAKHISSYFDGIHHVALR